MGSWPKKTKALAVLCFSFVAGSLMISVFLPRYWPYREAAIRSQLSKRASAQVWFGHFRPQYWPPGCVAEDVVVREPDSRQPIVTIRRLTMMSTIKGFLHHRVTAVRAQGVHVWLKHSDLTRKQSGSTEEDTDTFEAEDGVLEISGKSPQHSLQFAFHSFSIRRIRQAKVTQFAAEFQNPLPKGLVRTSGQFGPWKDEHPEQTPVSGNYSLEKADLGVFVSIAGLTSSNGTFHGTFQSLQVEGSTITPQFKVVSTGHALPLTTHFDALVDSTTGDVTLRRVEARFGHDDISAHGTIARNARGRRAAILDFDCRRGRVEDTFYPFIHSPASPLAGTVAFQMHVILPSGSERFLQRITLESDFRIQDARFTHEETQARVNKIGETPGKANSQAVSSLSDFTGKVQVRNGVAHFSELSVQDGGASGQFRGTYNLVDEQVDMHGKLKTEATLANTTHGIKAVFAKALEPFFKKKPHENVVPVKIGGTYSHPAFGLDLNTKM
jgi:AsmA-like protein